jgi:hypothetical protein
MTNEKEGRKETLKVYRIVIYLGGNPWYKNGPEGGVGMGINKIQ